MYSADSKMAELQQLAGLAIEGGVQFVKEAVRHLVEARHTLVASYGYAYFIMIKRVKEEFERMQVTRNQYDCAIIACLFSGVWSYRVISKKQWKP